MKKILIVSLCFLLGSTIAKSAGITTLMKSNLNFTSDTITDAGNGYLSLQVQGTYSQISIEVVVTKISGTVAGSVVLQASIDGTNYYNISTDSLNNTDVTTNKKIWVLSGSQYLYYKVYQVGAGTMAASVKAYLYANSIGSVRHASQTLKSIRNFNSDTVTNSATKYVGMRIQSYYTTLGVQVVITKLSGTGGGTVTLQGSNDAINYVTVSSSFSDAQTLSVANVTSQTKLFVITGSPYAYYRLSYTGTGTMACTIKGYVLPNP